MRSADGRPEFRQATAEDLRLKPGEACDPTFAVRVGALDGRHPEAAQRALARIRPAPSPRGRLFIDGGDPLRELALSARPRDG